MKLKIFKFDKVTSTNDVAIDLIKNKKKENGYIYADEQTEGRGTHGKKWISIKGNLFCTVFFQLKKKYPPFNEFSFINPLIISKAIKEFCGKEKISIKWPNDLLLNKRKFCGILQEIINFNNKEFLVIGMGINLISNPKLLDNYQSTSIFLETKKKPKQLEIIHKIIYYYEQFFSNLNFYDFKKIKEELDI